MIGFPSVPELVALRCFGFSFVTRGCNANRVYSGGNAIELSGAYSRRIAGGVGLQAGSVKVSVTSLAVLSGVGVIQSRRRRSANNYITNV